MRTRLISLVCLLALVVAGCGTFLTPAAESPELPPLEPTRTPTHPPLDTFLLASPTKASFATPLPDLPTQGDITPMNPSLSNLENLIAKAMENLAQQLSISSSQISLVEATEVIWPNSSLGCPQEGMVYAEVLTPGYLIRLDYAGVIYEYHASRDSYLTTCENPTPPLIGTPDNT